MEVAIRDAMVPGAEDGRLFEGLRALGLSSVELEVSPNGSLPRLAEAGGRAAVADAGEVKDLLDRRRVRVCALLLATDISGDQADEHVAWAIEAARAAEVLGVPAVRIDPLARQKDIEPADVRDRFVHAVSRVLREMPGDAAAGGPVSLAVENHGPHANDPAFLDAVFAAIPDRRLGLTLDTGNFYWFGHPLAEVYRLIEQFAVRTRHTHLKNINYPPGLANRRREVGHDYRNACCPLDEGNIELARVVGILRRADYSGDLCIENESLFKYTPQQQIEVLRRDAQAVRAAVAAGS